MFSSTDTIVAVATPGGRAGLGVVRLSGPRAHDIACGLIGRTMPLTPRHATFARLTSPGGVADHVVVTFFASPHSYTTEDTVELSAHGSPVVLQQIVRDAIHGGARLARPGEFTFRAFLNGRMDLTQAEAVADLIEAATPRQAQAASAQLDGELGRRIRDLDTGLLDLVARLEASLDFPEEGYHFVSPGSVRETLGELLARTQSLLDGAREGRLVREGARVVIVGAPNVGKSSLFNYLSRSERAIVTDRAGTTRDVLIEAIDLDGIPVTLVDTAGLRDSGDPVEQEGVRRARSAMETADALLVLLDCSREIRAEDRILLEQTAARPRVIVMHKCDCPASWPPEAVLAGPDAWCKVSSRTGEGFEELLDRLRSVLGASSRPADAARITNVRHSALLERCAASLSRAMSECVRSGDRAPEELLLFELGDARSALVEVVGLHPQDEVLTYVFDRFCIGK